MNVIFLGAGASKALGFPANSEILPKIFDNVSNKKTSSSRELEKRRILRETFQQLVPGFSADNEKVGITDILSLIDFSISSGISLLPKDGFFEMRRIRHLVDMAIIEVLNVKPNNIEKIQAFARVIKRFKEAVIITSNYDLIPETVLKTAGIKALDLDYGFDWRRVKTGKIIRRPAKNSYALLKLHGSLNWLRCPSCEQIYINLSAAIANLSDYREGKKYGEAVTCDCEYAPLRSLLVTPSLARTHPEMQLKQLVLSAVDYLSQARSVSIIGYSLPSEDLAIRSMFIRGMRANKFQPKVEVFQVSDEARGRYQAFFPQMEYFETGLDGFLERN